MPVMVGCFYWYYISPCVNINHTNQTYVFLLEAKSSLGWFSYDKTLFLFFSISILTWPLGSWKTYIVYLYTLISVIFSAKKFDWKKWYIFGGAWNCGLWTVIFIHITQFLISFWHLILQLSWLMNTLDPPVWEYTNCFTQGYEQISYSLLYLWVS